MACDLRLTSDESLNYVGSLDIFLGNNPILRLDSGTLKLAMHPTDLRSLMNGLPLSSEGVDLVFEMCQFGEYGLKGVKRIYPLPDPIMGYV